MRTIPWLILDGRNSSFGDLAGEAFALARKRAFPDETVTDRLKYWGKGRRLKRAARWSEMRNWSQRQFLWKVGIRRYAAILFGLPAALLAVFAIRDPSILPLGFLWMLSVFAAISVAAGLGFAGSAWGRIQKDIGWAESYRIHRMEVDARLRSPEGYQGWRATKDEDGIWTLEAVPADRTTS